MTGSWRLPMGFGGFGALLTFLFSLSNNPFGTHYFAKLLCILSVRHSCICSKVCTSTVNGTRTF